MSNSNDRQITPDQCHTAASHPRRVVSLLKQQAVREGPLLVAAAFSPTRRVKAYRDLRESSSVFAQTGEEIAFRDRLAGLPFPESFGVQSRRQCYNLRSVVPCLLFIDPHCLGARCSPTTAP
jgi:hypothetical protein